MRGKVKVLPITDAELPKCHVCKEQCSRDRNAEFLAYIGVRLVSSGMHSLMEYQDWHLVCALHRRSYAAFQLVRTPMLRAPDARFRHTDRNKAIVAQAKLGCGYTYLAEKYEITPQRVRQIVERARQLKRRKRR